jgi:hypothetical protein
MDDEGCVGDRQLHSKIQLLAETNGGNPDAVEAICRRYLEDHTFFFKRISMDTERLTDLDGGDDFERVEGRPPELRRRPGPFSTVYEAPSSGWRTSSTPCSPPGAPKPRRA